MLSLAPILSDGAVFQRNRAIRIFGEARGTVTATLAGTAVSAGADGRFVLTFPPMDAGGPYTLTVVCGPQERTLKDIYIGDVVLLAGQSNLQFRVSDASDRPASIEPDSLLRVFHCPRLECADAFDNRWNDLTAENAANWSAIGYFLGTALRAKRKVPVGFVTVYQGASVIQSFLSPEANAAFPIPREEKHPDHRNTTYTVWNVPGTIYREMLLPIVPFAVSAVVWYQGESNTAPAEGRIYDKMLLRLMQDWRQLLQCPELPFVIVQLNDFQTPWSQEGWALVQQAQQKAAGADPHAALAVISDLGCAHQIHPDNKARATLRILAALEGLQ